MRRRVKHAHATAGRVAQQVHPLETEQRPQRLDILDEPVHTVSRGVRRLPGLAGTTVVEQDEATVRGKTTEVTEILHGLTGTARHANQWRTHADRPVGELGAVV